MTAPPAHRAVLDPEVAKAEVEHQGRVIFNKRFGWVTIKQGKPSPGA